MKQQIGVKVTMRGARANAFVEQAVQAREGKLSANQFDQNGNFAFGSVVGNTTPSPAWNNGTALTCTGCHGLPPTGHPTLTGPVTAATCSACHPTTVKADGTIDIAGGKHVNGLAEFEGAHSDPLWADPTHHGYQASAAGVQTCTTCHVAFGRRVGALPSGRRAGATLASSLGPANGCDRKGPTAILHSVAGLDHDKMPNGYALNLRFDPRNLEGEEGVEKLVGLMKAFDTQGGMELQFNVLDPEVLEDARHHPGKYPGLVVRVAGYCAYFDDLPDAVKDEILARTLL
jgi:predicted CxxxxCH...CXXCH cytochrome family protein